MLFKEETFHHVGQLPLPVEVLVHFFDRPEFLRKLNDVSCTVFIESALVLNSQHFQFFTHSMQRRGVFDRLRHSCTVDTCQLRKRARVPVQLLS